MNTSSEAFLAGSAGQPNYAAAKGGIVGLTTSTALALAKYGVTANAICPRARTRMTEDVFAGFELPEDRLDPLAPEHVAPLVGYLAAPAAARLNGQLLVVHGGMVAVVERPRVQAKFDSKQETFTYDELDALLTPHFAERPEGDLRGGGSAGAETRVARTENGPAHRDGERGRTSCVLSPCGPPTRSRRPACGAGREGPNRRPEPRPDRGACRDRRHPGNRCAAAGSCVRRSSEKLTPST